MQDDFAERIRRIHTTIRERARQGGVDSLFSEIVSLIENHRHEFWCEDKVVPRPPYEVERGGRTEDPS